MIKLLLPLLLIAACTAGASQFVSLGMTPRDEGGPQGLSGITPIGDSGLYFCIDDTGGNLHEYKVAFSETGSVESFKLRRTVRLEGVRDGESCAFDPLTGRVWVAGEYGSVVASFNPNTGKRVAKLTIPEIYRKDMRPNCGIEGLSISRDGLTMWIVNEDTLKSDGEIASKISGGKVRFTEFRRTGASSPWQISRTLFYHTDKIDGEPFNKMSISGVADILVEDDGALLVLEREMSMKNPLFPTFRGRIYRAEVKGVANGGMFTKKRLWDENTAFSNYEGMCHAHKSPKGARNIILISDAGHAAGDSVLVLSRPERIAPSVTVQPLADEDFLEESVLNEVDHAISRAGSKGEGPVRANLPFATKDMSRSKIALKLVSAQKGDGRWLDGTNDYTAAAVRILKKIRNH